MALALYEPGLGYYANGSRKFGSMPGSGSDFVTAPELSPLFGRALAAQVAQALDAGGSARCGVRRRLGRAGRSSCWMRWAMPSPLRHRRPVGHCGSASRRAWRASAAGCAGWTRCPTASRRGGRQRGAGRHAGAAAALRRRSLVRARRGLDAAAAWPGPTARPRCARRWTRLRARHRDRDPPAGRGLHAHPGRALQRGAAFFIDYGFPEPSTTTRSATAAR
jgi:hypothetical protein